MRRRFSLATRLAVLVALPVVGAPCAPARAATPRLPDLVALPPARPLLTIDSSGAVTRELLRFDGILHNQGAGALEVDGSRASATDPMLPSQRVFADDGTSILDPLPDAVLAFEPADGHDHWHLHDAARYSLWAADRSAEVAPAMK